MASLSLSIGTAASGTQNVTANNDTVTFTSTGWKGSSSWSTSTSNCSVSPSSGQIPSGQGTVQVTVSDFPRSTSNGSWSVTISGQRPGGDTSTTTAVGDGTILASTGTITISGMDSNNAFGIGDTGTVSWSSNDETAKGYNSTDNNATPRFSPKSGASALSGTSGSFTLTAVGTGQGDPAVASTNKYSLRLAGSGSAIIASSNSVVVHKNANAGTATATVTSSNLATGAFTVTGSTTATAPGTINYRFLNSTGNLMPGSAYSTTNTYTYPGSERNKSVEMEVREQITSGSTVYSQSFTQDFVTAAYIGASGSFTVGGQSTRFMAWDATSFTVNISGAQEGDQIRVVLDGTNTNLTGFTNVPASGSLSLSCTASLGNFPRGTAVNVSCQYRRPVAVGGSNNVGAGVGLFSIQRNYRAPRIVSIPDKSATIGAQEGETGGPGSPNTTVALTGDFSDSQGALYQIRIGSTVIATSSPVSGTTVPIVIPQASLPSPNSSQAYQVFGTFPVAEGGNGSYIPVYSFMAAIPGGGRECFIVVTRSNYVSPDTSITHSTSATGVDVNFRSYQIGASSTSETITYSGGSSSTQYRVLEVIGNNQCDTNTGATGTLSIPNSFLPAAGSNKVYWVQARVTTANNGNNQWVNTDDYAYSGAAYVYGLARESLATPTAVTLSAYKNANDGSRIVPSLSLSWNGGTGEVEYAFSTTNSTPSNWTGTGFVDNGNSSLSRVSGPSTSRASNALYMGVRQKSVIDGTTTTPSYASNTSGPYYNEVGTQDRFITVVYNGNTLYPADGDMPVVVLASDTSNDITVGIGGKESFTETKINPNSVGNSGLGSDTVYASYRIRTNTADSNIGASGTLVGSDTNNSATAVSFNLANPSELPAQGNNVNYKVYEFVFTARGGRGTEVATTPIIDNQVSVSRLAAIDTSIVVNSVPANRFTISAQSPSFSITISSGNSNTDYRVVLVSQTGTNLTVGSVYGSRTGNGNITLTGKPVQGEFATYRIQARAVGSSGSWTNTTGANSTFTAGRYKPLSFAGSSGGSITDVPINSSVSTATLSLSGVVGTARVYVSASTGNATVKVIKNTDAPVVATNASPVNVVNGDIIGLQFTVGGGYSETSTATISIDQPLNTTLQTGPVFSITTEASSGGSEGGSGGIGNYGLEVYDSSGDLILSNSDLVGDFCYSDTVSIASGASTGISGVNTKGGNIVLIQENLNPFSDNQRAEAVLQNSGKQVRINLVDATASTSLTFNVLVFSL